MASAAAALGYDLEAIKRLRHWASNSYRRYCMYMPSLKSRQVPGPISFSACMAVAVRQLHILIISHSYVFWLARYAAKSTWGSTLGLGARVQIESKGQRGMLWGQFCNQWKQAGVTWETSQVVSSGGIRIDSSKAKV